MWRYILDTYFAFEPLILRVCCCGMGVAYSPLDRIAFDQEPEDPPKSDQYEDRAQRARHTGFKNVHWKRPKIVAVAPPRWIALPLPPIPRLANAFSRLFPLSICPLLKRLAYVRNYSVPFLT